MGSIDSYAVAGSGSHKRAVAAPAPLPPQRERPPPTHTHERELLSSQTSTTRSRLETRRAGKAWPGRLPALIGVWWRGWDAPVEAWRSGRPLERWSREGLRGEGMPRSCCCCCLLWPCSTAASEIDRKTERDLSPPLLCVCEIARPLCVCVCFSFRLLAVCTSLQLTAY
jgi:hypothetical protein